MGKEKKEKKAKVETKERKDVKRKRESTPVDDKKGKKAKEVVRKPAEKVAGPATVPLSKNRLLDIHFPKISSDEKSSLSLASLTTRTPPVLSKFERSLLLGHRTRELCLGFDTSAPITRWCPGEIAETELKLGLLDDYTIRRSAGGNSTNVEEWIVGDFDIVT
eukprot:TRINITY_DN29916_c0_g1_i1.p1 TRINITY_DN29916_c0_g1~~TRINITY_DN29916_c0_g1_i1.p1  ORF type:complete len:180 (+),score=40.76 TRINITY_DN29916_c0_g1_i1:54-542(+)